MNELREKIAEIVRGDSVCTEVRAWYPEADAILALPELQELMRDAERYRWLAGADVPAHSVRWSRFKLEYWGGFHGGWVPLVGVELDAAIDHAREKQE